MGLDVAAELRQIAAFYCADDSRFDQASGQLARHLEDYFEVVFAERHFEIITGGNGLGIERSLAHLGGLTRASSEAFLACDAEFPNSVKGLKMGFGTGRARSASLYVRTKSPCEAVYKFLRDTLGLEADVLSKLGESLAGVEVFYGLGFYDAPAGSSIKTYTLGDVVDGAVGRSCLGFLSQRIEGGELRPEVKSYAPEVPLSQFVPPDGRWREIANLIEHELGYQTAGHVGHIAGGGMKIYVERVGAIPTDFDAR